MAAYSAYRHVELDKIGFGKRRVLKPPGGGTSDLFATPPDQADSPRKIRAPAMSLPLEDTSPIASSDVPVFKPGNDSHSRLFGPPDEPPKPRRHQASSIVLGSEEKLTEKIVADSCKGDESNGTEQKENVTNAQVADSEVKASLISRNCVTGEGCDDSLPRSRKMRPQGGNPVTGEGYESPKGGSGAQLSNGAGAQVLRNRVPPGGFSSGLW